MPKKKINKCWICQSKELTLKKKSNIQKEHLDSQNFAITNYEYGVTGSLYECQNCSFVQCSDLTNVLGFYEDLEDPDYEVGRAQRILQEQKILEKIQRIKPTGKLLDIGAGSGMLVEAAHSLGYQAEGIEPSKWLQRQAQKMKLPIHLGTFPHPSTKGPYDIITLVDVIEHVPNPVELMREITTALSKDGIFVVVTPNKNSFIARLLGHKWWHYRIAHIGYFNKKTLALATKKAQLNCVKLTGPTWYFKGSYLAERVLSYFPSFLRLPIPKFLDKVVVPLNLGDSLLGIYKKKED